MPVSLRVEYLCRRFRSCISEGGLLLFYFCVLATGINAQTKPSREYIRLGTRVIAIENPPPTVAAPTFLPPGGTYCALTVTISTATAGATIRYTLDGSTPSETNRTAGTSFTISSTPTLRAIAYKNEDTNGALAANPMADDMRIGTSHGRTLFIPGLVSGRDATRRTMAVVVRPGLPASILVSSAGFALADDKGNALGPGVTQVSLPSGTVVIAASTSATLLPLGTAGGDGEEVREAA
jgi:Chitobiase/beta-hexosaminidase C-terminal domain